MRLTAKLTGGLDIKAIEQATFKAARENIKRRLESVRCPEHGKVATVTCSGNTLRELKWEVSGCCQSLIDQAKAGTK